MDALTGENLLAQGRTTMVRDGLWGAPNGTPIKFGFAPLPSIDGIHPMHRFMTYIGYAVNRLSHHPIEAFSLIAYVTRRVPAAGRDACLPRDSGHQEPSTVSHRARRPDPCRRSCGGGDRRSHAQHPRNGSGLGAVRRRAPVGNQGSGQSRCRGSRVCSECDGSSPVRQGRYTKPCGGLLPMK
jgi:hypothetical protein